MKKYSVHVCRIGYGHNNIVVEAANEKEAMRKAEEIAPNESFSDKESEYEAQSATEIESGDGIKRICDLCKEDASGKTGAFALNQVSNRRGHSLGLFCGDCAGLVSESVNQSPLSYGSSSLSEKEINLAIIDRVKRR